jgi:SAM-dependent methyltransferase
MTRVRSALPQSPKVVLDFGGGEGPYKGYLATADDLYIVLEADYNSYSVQKNLGRHQYVIGDGHSSLFLDNSFDVISMFEVLEHVRNPFQIFANCARWLKPGGVLALSVPQYWHVHGWPSDYFRYTVYGLGELAATAGLRMTDSWALGGPCVLIWSVVELNFASVLRLPIVRQFLAYPAFLVALFGDWIFFRNQLSHTHPDTRGWMAIVHKPDMDSRPGAFPPEARVIDPNQR